MRWISPETDSEDAERLAGELGMPAACARILLARGFSSPEAVKALLNTDLSQLPDPFTLRGMEAASKRIAQAVIGRERIAIFGDYDVDGVTATATLF